MTNNIYPPDHLLRTWEELIIDEEQNVDVVLYEAFQAGADQELEACCEWVDDNFDHCNSTDRSNWLRAARRPNPPSRKQRGLSALKATNLKKDDPLLYQEILNAIEGLPND